MADSIVTVTQNNVNKIVTVGGQILKAPVNAGSLQETKSYTVSAAGTSTISPDTGYNGMEEVNLTVPTLTLPTSTSASSSGTAKLTINRSTSTQYINIPSGFNNTASYYTISSTPNMTLPISASTSASGTTQKATITPTTANRYINIPTGYNGTSSYYTIEGDADLTASNIKNGVSIFGITGNYGGSGNIEASKTCNINSSGTISVTPSSGYDGIAEVTVNVPAGNCSCPSSILVENVNIANLYGTAGIQTNVSLTPQVNAGYISTGTSNTPLLTIYSTSPYWDTSPLTVQGSTLTAPAGFYPQAYNYTLSGTGELKTIIMSSKSHTLTITNLSSRPSSIIGVYRKSAMSTPSDVIAFCATDNGTIVLYTSSSATVSANVSYSYSSQTYSITLTDSSDYFCASTSSYPWYVACS